MINNNDLLMMSEIFLNDQYSYNPPKFDEAGIPLFLFKDGKYYYHPIVISQYGITSYNKYLLNNDNTYLLISKKILDWLVKNQDKKNGKWYYLFDFSVGGGYHNFTLKAPWSSAMAQGQVLSLISYLYKHYPEKIYIECGKLAILPLLKNVQYGGLMRDFEKHDFYFEEYPTNPPSYTLNGFMFTIIGLYNFNKINHSADIDNLLDTSVKTLVYCLPYYDTPTISKYHLGDLILKNNKIHTSQKYHEIHILQLGYLHKFTKNENIYKFMNKWRKT